MKSKICIAIIGAMNQEMKWFMSNISTNLVFSKKCYKIYFGRFNNLDIYLLESGIGKVSASIGTTLLLEKFNPDIVINVGSAGSVDSSIDIGNIVISTEVCYHDVNLVDFGYSLGQIPNFPSRFLSEEKLINVVKRCIKKFNLLNINFGLICSGDCFISDSERLLFIKKNFLGVIAIDMEGAAIAHVCYNFKTPFLIIRSISDFSGNKKSIDCFKQNLSFAMCKLNFLIEKILNFLTTCDLVNFIKLRV